MIITSIIITILYLLLIGSFIFGFDKVQEFHLEDLPEKTKFSIIVPFRNESKNIPELLQAISNINYPNHLFEVILVDDASDDNSMELIKKFITLNKTNLKTIPNERLTSSPKKDAITTAVKHAKNDWVITTDADCTFSKYWLNSFDEFIQKTDAQCIAAPVSFIEANTFLNKFQVLDLLSLQGATIGGFGINKPFLCNGANFAYKKSLFKSLNGFEGNTNIASGDDIFFLEKVVNKHSKSLHFLKSKHAIVKTKTQQSMKGLIAQRIRWAAKTTNYNSLTGKLTGLIVLTTNGLVITVLLLVLLGLFHVKTLGYLVFLKLNIDFLLIYKSAVFFNQKKALKSYFLAFLVYPFFSFYIALISLFKTYKWKGRTFKK